ncbi:MAG: hypothetical protein SFW36_05355 [Leptolyngbyaceae cyanobacterium bins.59]|nr:hypothetical protein [Leptolyngbyaceae cyanobacterium bins.59]
MLLSPIVASAQTSVPAPSQAPLDTTLLRLEESQVPTPGICITPPDVVTSKTICQASLTLPSLWWAKQQFGGQVLENWLAYGSTGASPGRVDLVVNPQAWSLLNYLERYEFIDKFGSIAREFGYNTRVFNRQGEKLAAYTCSYRTASAMDQTPATQPLKAVLPCAIDLDSAQRNRLRGRSGGLSP